MEFQPFWKLLEQMGINLPEPSRLKKIPPTRRKTPKNRRQSSSDEEMIDLLGALQMMAALDEFARLSSDEQEPRQLKSAHFAPQAPQPERDCWVPFGETVQVGDYEIPGMVYVGNHLPSLRNHAVEPSLIRPMLNVTRRRPDYTKPPAAYNPSYTQMRDAERAAYLAWSAEGRCNPKAHSSYVWLFYYGLERRLLHDLLQLKQDDAWKAEVRQIEVEIKRLKQLYGNPVANWSLDHKTTALLEICDLLLSAGQTRQPLNLEKAPLLSLQVGLGQLVKQNQPIPADWALTWYTRLANNPLPAVVNRCPEEFKTLFELRYGQTYGAGMIVKPGKTKLTVGYFPSNPSFGRMVDVPVGDLPDLSRFTAKLNKIAELIYACRAELDPLSRLLGRNVNARGTAAAIALLPTDLMEQHGGQILKRLRTWLKQCFAKSPMPLISGQELLKHWSGSHPDKFTSGEAQSLSKLLAHLGYGLEPDPRFGAPPITAKSSLVLFLWPEQHPENLSSEYFDATLQLQMALSVASGDDAASPVEHQYLEQQVAQFPGLSAAERVRLQAHLQLLRHQHPVLRNLKVRIDRLELQKRPAVAQLLLQVAAADGPISPTEVKLLEKAYQMLDLDPQGLYSDIHDFSTLPALKPTASEPVTVLKASPSKGHKIPVRPKAGLDMNLVQSKIAESHEISSLLADIFTEAEMPRAAQPPVQPKAEARARSKSGAKPGAKPGAKTKKSTTSKPSQPAATITGLDEAHSELLRSLVQQAIWPRSELITLAGQLDLMLDGALEVINELAFERTEEPVTEGDEMIEVNQTVLRELLG